MTLKSFVFFQFIRCQGVWGGCLGRVWYECEYECVFVCLCVCVCVREGGGEMISIRGFIQLLLLGVG